VLLPIHHSVLFLARVEFVECVEGFRDRSDAAYEQNYLAVSKIPSQKQVRDWRAVRRATICMVDIAKVPFPIISLPPKNEERITLTTRKDHPNKIHKKVIKPKIQKLRPAVRNPRIVMIKHARRIIKYQSIDLAHADDNLERVPKRVRFNNQEGEQETDWAPGELFPSNNVSLWGSKWEGGDVRQSQFPCRERRGRRLGIWSR
jgi:hypothetical protein